VTVSDLTEAELVARIQSRLPPAPDWLIVGIGDDAAVVEPARGRLEVLTVDSVVEGVHFDRRFTPPGAIGHRALAVNLSDLAAMGAQPRLALLSLALPATLACGDFDELVGGLTALATRERLTVVGGNLTRSPGPLVVDVTVAGTVKRRQALTRGGARPGDGIFVTGTIGAAAAGLQMLRAARPELQGNGQRCAADEQDAAGVQRCIHRYLYAQPRIRIGLLLARNRAATACMDLSDGLADGVRRVAEASGVGILLDADRLPIDPGARRWFDACGADPVVEALSGGDDYELVFASRPKLLGRLRAVTAHGGVPVTRVGVCTPEPGLLVRRGRESAGTTIPLPLGFSHFR